MINIYKQPESANTYANLFIQEIPDKVKNVCLLFIGHLETIYNILVAKPDVNFTVIDGSDTTEALPYIYNGANLKESITFEDGWCEANDTFVEGLHSIFNNMPFDLIIANPPYGKQCKLAKPIIKKILEAAPIAVVLCETIGFTQDESIMHKVVHLEKIPNPFTDALIQNLAIAKLNSAANNVEFSREFFTLDDKRYQLVQAIKSYNKTHARSWENIAYFNTKETKKLSECKTYDCILADASCKDLFENNQVFVYTIRVAGDGVHVDGDDTKVNSLEKDAWINPYKRYFDAFVFATSLEKQNFRNWWNSCIQNTGKKSRDGLTNTILSIICECVSGGAGVEAYKTYFPNLDWSKSWTDQEILKEIGLSEDFLEKE